MARPTLRTLFHIVSYTLFDKDKNEVYRGNNFFTCMNLENPDKLRKEQPQEFIQDSIYHYQDFGRGLTFFFIDTFIIFSFEPNGYPSLGFFLYLNLHTDVISLQNRTLTFAP